MTAPRESGTRRRGENWHRCGMATTASTPAGRRVVTVALRGPVTVWDIKTATVEKVFSLPAGFAYDLSSRGELAAADSDGNVRLLDLARGEVRLQWKAHEESVHHLAFNAAGHRIVKAAYG